MAGMKGKPVSERPIWLWPLLGFLLPVGVGGVFLFFQWRQWAQKPVIIQKAPPTTQETSIPPPTEPAGFIPGVEGWSSDEYCKSASLACQQWTELARKCASNMRRREAGYMGRLEPYCTQAEELRERVTGISLSGAPGGYDF
jgi:hypothetical protein